MNTGDGLPNLKTQIPLLEANSYSPSQKSALTFVKPESTLHCSQEHAIGLHSDPHVSYSHLTLYDHV